MAARNVKSMPSFDPQDKMQSNTLKRQPSPDWSKNDLLRLLSYFEGELQARDIVIAALKAEKAKQLLYQAKYGRFGLGDPFMALQRDAVGTKDSNFDEAAVKAMYDNQLAQLENLIATQRKAQLKMREQLTNAEKRYHKVCSELEEEKRKHAQDTAQGDDVTYMLEKERERLRQEIDFEKSSSKKMEKDLRRTLAALEEERASAARHKQVALLLLKERKQILQRIASEYQQRGQAETLLSEDQLHAEDVAEGLEAESRHSLAMEAALEQQLGEFEAERAALREGLNQEQARTRELEAQVEALQKQVQILAARTSLESIEIKSSVSPQASTAHSSTPPTSLVHPSGMSTGLGPVAYSPTSSPTGVRAGSGMGAIGSSLAPGPSRSAVSMVGGGTSAPLVWQVHKVNKVLEGGRIGSSSPEREVIYRPLDSPSTRKIQYGGGAAGSYSSPSLDRQGTAPLSGSPRGEARVMTVGSSGPESAPVLVGGGGLSSPGARVNITPGNSATVVTQGGGKISFHVSPGSGGSSIISAGAGGVGGGGAGSPRRTAIAVAASAGRGVPPPVPPNKPNIVSISPGATKPSPPPKVGLMGRGGTESSSLHSKTVQIPVNVVASASSVSSSPSSSSQSPRESSPIRKTAQPSQSFELDTPAVSSNIMQANPATSLEFLGPEMANLQAMLASLSAGETSTCDTPSVELPPPSAPAPLSDPQNSSTVISHNSMLSSFPLGINNSIVHKLTASGDVNTLRFLVLENDADVNMPLKDGTTLIHTAVENNQGDCLQLLLDSNGNASAPREDHITPLHIAAAKGHIGCFWKKVLQSTLSHRQVIHPYT
ncbi:CTTNBP2 N-terminal-like protein isoform X2 [Pomacea canaliculata]|uniref:CTTNBP2 N-terminal-like protein isoform X2 n=1 Tax=Pomacea canaliculata TaxID=400727 RepID=UPI000D731FB5|nr:CTTNBP2 N-terminal-like protein isoform X2 [Pomacea canaliculata]